MSRDRFAVMQPRKNRTEGGKLRKMRQRKMFFETLETRQLLVSPGDVGTIWESFPGNYVPDNEYRSAGENYGPLTAPSTANRETIAINYLKQNAAFFDAIPSDFDHYNVSRQYTDAHNSVTHIYLQQTFNDLPVADAVANISINQHGQIIAVGANFVSGLPHPATPFTPQPAITAADALSIVGAETQRSVDII
jgi:Zn-dependent metalloprotease